MKRTMNHHALSLAVALCLIVLTMPGVGAEPNTPRIVLFAPADGGTPRDPNRIEAVGPGEFRVRACAEEGRSPLTHAVSRVDLICRNDGGEPQDVTLHLDLSDEGRRTNAENNTFGGMSTRDFIFIQPPGQPWRQINGHVAGWVCTVRFSAPPGQTKVGLSPWYTYADYLHFVQGLPNHPHLTKTRLGDSDAGREHWELIITDPNVPAERKRTIFWHAREHAYETFSSYAVEGLVTYLLSDAAADARRRYQIALHPMTNVDGVAQGYEYRSGYDFPQARGTATAKLTFDAMDRLRPHVAVTWHNWVAPRDIDCLFYTDSEEGKPSRRAWDLFTQRFPSPRRVGHRWESEANPLAKNWFGRSLSENNVHQYAMKRYGTRVWGWEMPWWGRDEHDARKAGADFGRALLATLDAIQGANTPTPAATLLVTVPLWQMHEFELHGRCHVDNPFCDAALVGEFTSPSGKKVTAEGFYDGGDTWRLRFTPDEEGEWRFLLRGEGVELFHRGQLRCVAPRNERLDAAFNLIHEAVEKGEVPGAIALVAHNGRIVRQEAIGLSDPEQQTPFRTNTLCWIASVTKPVTVAAAMTLMDEGKLSLDDPVEKYLPEFREQADANGVHYAVTVRHLMTHTAGIVNDPPTRPRGVWAIGGALEDSWLTATDHAGIVRAIAQSPLLFKPGSQVKYSSAAMFVLGRLIEVISGKPYAQFVKERILDPLGMKDSYYAPPATEAGRVSAIFAEVQGKREAIFRFNPELKITNAGPDGGLFSYPAELVKFLQMFLDNDGKVLSQAAVRAMLEEQAPGRGLGWALDDGCFHHGGSSGTEAFADLKTGTIGILFFQFRDRKGRTLQLASDFRRQVRAAFNSTAGGIAPNGFIRVHPDNPYAFAYADGTPFFPMGDTCYGLYSDSPITPALRTHYLKTRRSQRFNFVRMGVIHSPTHGHTDLTYWPWGGTPEKPDLDRFNPQFFRGLDAVLTEMQTVGMNAELIVLNYYLRPFTDVKAWTPQRERQWLRYVTARYAAFPNLSLWTIANEYETHPEGRYRLDVPDDPDWAKATARFIKQHDPYRHPVTVHPVVSATTRGSSPRDPFDPPWRIGEFFGKDDAMDVLSQQTGQAGEGVVWDEQLQCWKGDAPDLVASLRADRRYSRPVLNTESGYEYLRGHPTEKKQVHHTDKVRHSTWRIVCAGGYFAAGFHGTIGHSDSWNRIDAPNRYSFVVKDEGAAAQLGLLYDFFTSLPFWRMQPFEAVAPETAVALAEPGQVYVVYLPHGGDVSVDLSEERSSLAVSWLNPRSGETVESQSIDGGSKRSFNAPFDGDAVLYLRRTNQ